MKRGTLFGVGVGPGDPELMTSKAIRILQEADLIGIPAKEAERCTAWRIVVRALPNLKDKEVYPLPIPMTSEISHLQEAYAQAEKEIIKYLEQGKRIAFLNLGDPTLYGSYMELHERIAKKGYDCEIVSGIPSFCAGAAKLGISLGKREERIHILPGFYGMQSPEKLYQQMLDLLDANGKLILMKSAGEMEAIWEFLEKLERKLQVSIRGITNCGMEGEQCYECLADIPKQPGYFTLLYISLPEKEKCRYRSTGGKQLRCGVTTGSCATAAALAAAKRLICLEPVEEITFLTPSKTVLQLPVQEASYVPGESCNYFVIKDSGDDPDVTDGMPVHVQIYLKQQGACGDTAVDGAFEKRWRSAFTSTYSWGSIYLEGGIGVGRITQEGMEQKVEQAAINKVPRQMIFSALEELAQKTNYRGDLYVEIQLPRGEELGKKTFNPHLGIQGGLSILGTSGILVPMSEQAIVDTIAAQVRQQMLLGKKEVLFVPGNYGERYVRELLGWKDTSCIQCSNYIGEALDYAVTYGMEKVTLVGNLGKFIKLAGGIMNTHSKIADARAELMGLSAAMQGATKDQLQELLQCSTTEQMLGLLEDWGLREQVIRDLLDRMCYYVRRRMGERIEVKIYLFSEQYGLLAAT